LAERAALPVAPWPAAARDALVALLGAGTAAIGVWEALDQAGLIVRLLPGWERVRNRPQRDPVHRFTVDRHLVETAAGAAALAREVDRPDLLLIGALLHDIGKGGPGDHSTRGAVLARDIGATLGYPEGDARVLETMVRYHLLLPETATRRDIDDPATVAAVLGALSAAPSREREVLDLLAALAVADVRTEAPVTPGMRQRIGSITKTFVATAVLQQVEAGRLQLDTPIGRYLPDLFPGPRGRLITVRMLLNHTSGIGDYVLTAFPSLADASPASLDRFRFRTLRPEQLIEWGLSAPPTGEPGERWSYSNTNYVIAGLLLQTVTGVKAETYITDHVIRKAGLKHTYFPDGPRIREPHPRMYESLYQHVNPPRDYSTFDMSWASTAGSLVSTMDDLNTFYRKLLTGGLVGRASVAEMQRTVPVKDRDGGVLMNYGLGLYSLDLPCGKVWGHNGVVFGAGTQALSSPDGKRQIALASNLTKYQRLGADGLPTPDPIDSAMEAHVIQALCGGQAAAGGPSAGPGRAQPQPMPLRFARGYTP
uniref:serine hydrolase domain-containing protein n=1 Tax=Actinomadura roseirufa TaxID=2094049 RepID=UPI00104174EE